MFRTTVCHNNTSINQNFGLNEIQIDVLNQNSRIEYVSNFISMSINKVSRKDISASYLVLQIKEINRLNASDVEVY